MRSQLLTLFHRCSRPARVSIGAGLLSLSLLAGGIGAQAAHAQTPGTYCDPVVYATGCDAPQNLGANLSSGSIQLTWSYADTIANRPDWVTIKRTPKGPPDPTLQPATEIGRVNSDQATWTDYGASSGDWVRYEACSEYGTYDLQNPPPPYELCMSVTVGHGSGGNPGGGGGQGGGQGGCQPNCPAKPQTAPLVARDWDPAGYYILNFSFAAPGNPDHYLVRAFWWLGTGSDPESLPAGVEWYGTPADFAGAGQPGGGLGWGVNFDGTFATATTNSGELVNTYQFVVCALFNNASRPSSDQ